MPGHAAAGPLLAIVGETASGKSALALELARLFSGEIICADSWTVYKGFDIGTAKPSPAEQAEIPHHMIDVADPLEGFSAALFKEMAVSVMQQIHARGNLPILVGGTGLYIDSVLYDYGFLDQADPAERRVLDAMSLTELKEYAAAEGIGLEGIDVRNKRRVIRHIENRGTQPVRSELRQHTLVLGTSTPRDSLQARIEKRVDAMLAAGLEDEVCRLMNTYGWEVEPMKGIGYREWRAYLTGGQDIAETRQQIIRSTMQLAKKQRTWFRRNNSIHWIANRDEAVEITTTFLNT